MIGGPGLARFDVAIGNTKQLGVKLLGLELFTRDIHACRRDDVRCFSKPIERRLDSFLGKPDTHVLVRFALMASRRIRLSLSAMIAKSAAHFSAKSLASCDDIALG